jgi:cytidylate kinase
MKYKVVTIDGPACSGKGTIAKALASKLGWFHLDSGLLYRAVGYLFYQQPHQSHNDIVLTELLNQLDIDYKGGELGLYWQNRNIIPELRSELVSKWASVVAQEDFVRHRLSLLQHRIAEVVQNLVADGRDMGTVVFPEAQYKFYLTASLRVRAERRFEAEKRYDSSVQFNNVRNHLEERDKRDSQRIFAPLRKPVDALEIDTGIYSIEEVLEKILKHIQWLY